MSVVVGWPWLAAKPPPSPLLTPAEDGGENQKGKSKNNSGFKIKTV